MSIIRERRFDEISKTGETLAFENFHNKFLLYGQKICFVYKTISILPIYNKYNLTIYQVDNNKTMFFPRYQFKCVTGNMITQCNL